MFDNLKSVSNAYPAMVANSLEDKLSSSDRSPIWNLVETAVEAAEDRKGADIVVLRVTEVSYLGDYFVFITGFSRVQVRAISQAIQEKVEKLRKTIDH